MTEREENKIRIGYIVDVLSDTTDNSPMQAYFYGYEKQDDLSCLERDSIKTDRSIQENLKAVYGWNASTVTLRKYLRYLLDAGVINEALVEIRQAKAGSDGRKPRKGKGYYLAKNITVEPDANEKIAMEQENERTKYLGVNILEQVYGNEGVSSVEYEMIRDEIKKQFDENGKEAVIITEKAFPRRGKGNLVNYYMNEIADAIFEKELLFFLEEEWKNKKKQTKAFLEAFILDMKRWENLESGEQASRLKYNGVDDVLDELRSKAGELDSGVCKRAICDLLNAYDYAGARGYIDTCTKIKTIEGAMDMHSCVYCSQYRIGINNSGNNEIMIDLSEPVALDQRYIVDPKKLLCQNGRYVLIGNGQKLDEEDGREPSIDEVVICLDSMNFVRPTRKKLKNKDETNTRSIDNAGRTVWRMEIDYSEGSLVRLLEHLSNCERSGPKIELKYDKGQEKLIYFGSVDKKLIDWLIENGFSPKLLGLNTEGSKNKKKTISQDRNETIFRQNGNVERIVTRPEIAVYNYYIEKRKEIDSYLEKKLK